MALKVLMRRHKLDQLRAALDSLTEKDGEFKQREDELTADIEAVTTDEEQAAVDAAIEAYDTDKAAHEAEKERLAAEIAEIEAEIAADEQQQTPPPADEARAAEPTEMKVRVNNMDYNTRFRDMSVEQRAAFMERDDMKAFLTNVRDLAANRRSINGGDLLIPEIALGMLRAEAARTSKLLPFVDLRNVAGTGKMEIMGAIPEAIWTEMCANLNELEFGFNAVTVDGHEVGGFVPVCNALLEDSDINLASEIFSVLGSAIAKALDKAILFGVGNSKMPLGIVSRLAETEQPATWGARAPAWTDLHTSNIIKLNAGAARGVEFFAAIAAALGVAKPVYSTDGLFWVMNRKTRMDIMAKALTFNAAGALTAGVNTFPVIGGTIVEFEDDEIADYEIIGGFGGNYLLAQRQGVTFGRSDQQRFTSNQTVFKGYARYDGMPLAGEAFVVVNYANTDPTTTAEFPIDYANTDMNILTVTAAQGTATGDTVVTVGNTIATDDAVLAYKLRADISKIAVGDLPKGTWSELESGTTQITAAAGVQVAVVELDAAGRIVSVGSVASVPKAS